MRFIVKPLYGDTLIVFLKRVPSHAFQENSYQSASFGDSTSSYPIVRQFRAVFCSVVPRKLQPIE